jgi:hypothetical protein
VSDLLSFLETDELRIHSELASQAIKIPLWFRGQPDASKSLLTTMSALNFKPELEEALLNRFKQNAIPLLHPAPADADEWAWMFLMRHHRAPSRLLDWTESALIGLFFAVSHADDKDGALWILLPSVLNELAQIQENLRDPSDIPMFGSASDPFFNNYLITRVRNSRSHSVPPIAGIGGRNSERMTAQQGVFTIFHADLRPLEDWHDGSHIWRYVIPQASKPKVRHDLARLGVNRLTIFPELDSVSEVAWQLLNA